MSKVTSAFAKLPASATTKPEPFTISVPEAALTELKSLVHLGKIGPITFEGVQENRKYGISTEWLRQAKDKWENDFDWRKIEERLNAFPQYIADVVDDDRKLYKIHFTALFSEKSDAIPLVFLHGWPGSFLEFIPIISRLSKAYTPAELPYHVIVPSLPGYAFSSAPPLDKDFRIEDVARLINRLMVGLGFGDGYVVQGGDIGSKVARVLAAEYANCKAIHLNFCIMPEPKGIDPASMNEPERQGIARAKEFHRIGSAYALEHATRPSTIGLVLASSPIALLAWIGEKFLEWTDEDPSLDTVLESVTLYWLTETFPRSIYPYREVSRQLFIPGSLGAHEDPKWHIQKPFGYSWFPYELAPIPRSWAATTGDLVFYRQHTKGGHFAAVERPDTLLKDVEDFIAQVWPITRSE